MSIATDLARIQGAKADIIDAIEAKGVEVASGTKIDGLSALIEDIEAGGDDTEYIGMIQRSTAATSLPSGVTSIGQYAFYGCASIALTSLPSGVTSIGEYAFRDCASLALTSLPSGVTSISQYTFRSCVGLIMLNLPGVTTIAGTGASSGPFYGCTGLTSVTIGSAGHAATSIGAYAFTGCTNLTSIHVYTTGGNALSNAPWGAANASVTYHAA